ncbi:hypothetical protein [Streptomyces venezuelae]
MSETTTAARPPEPDFSVVTTEDDDTAVQAEAAQTEILAFLRAALAE